ncbi:MAG: CBS domain-containing protein [Candidatus Micrarchaeia archaeon]
MKTTEVGRIMDRRIVGVNASTKVSTAISLMKNTNVGIMPVIEDEKLVGILDEHALMNEAKAGLGELSKKEVRSIMKEPLYVRVDNTIDEALDYIIVHNASRVAVVDSNMRCVGIVSATEILDLKMREK